MQERRQMLRKAGKLCADALRRPCAGTEHARRGALPPACAGLSFWCLFCAVQVCAARGDGAGGEDLRGAWRVRVCACRWPGCGCEGIRRGQAITEDVNTVNVTKVYTFMV